jgi:23S rRNA (cytosine1962-C5)-methyltransferase
LERKGIFTKKKNAEITSLNENVEGEENMVKTEQMKKKDDQNPISIARELGMNPTSQFCDSSYAIKEDDNKNNKFITVDLYEPEIMGKIRVGGDEDSFTEMYAYIIKKPPGWSIMNISQKLEKNQVNLPNKDKIQQGNLQVKSQTIKKNDTKQQDGGKKAGYRSAIYYDDTTDSFDSLEYNENDLLAAMTPEEILEFQRDGGIDSLTFSEGNAKIVKSAMKSISEFDIDDELVDDGIELKDERSSERSSINNNNQISDRAIILPQYRPSVIDWLKKTKGEEGTPIRGGKYWVAVAGAVEVDDSGLVVVCPKNKVKNMFIEFTDYVAVVGNGKYLAPRPKKGRNESNLMQERPKIETISKLRTFRGDNTITTVKVRVVDTITTSDDIVQLCQDEFSDGICGDCNANPLDRRAHRRLLHCSSLSISSLVVDDSIAEECSLPDDIQILCDRKKNHKYRKGSFLGRNDLRDNIYNTAYREINGAGDGFPGWTVDRYDKWLFVQHDDTVDDRGPLPSLHDGYTSGVYYFATSPDRSIMNSVKPILLEGQPAPPMVSVKENGIIYHVGFEDMSTGIFLDQRIQRAWLAKHCTEETRVLNCFAHCGAFSVAAAMAGAETVSLDLDKKWRYRIEPQMKANGILNIESKHDFIYGDCFDWLSRLAKRGEKFDIVILDPPGTSVGGKKKSRWSAKNDYDELVTLAAPLVKPGGLLLTTTNLASMPPLKFVRIVKKGLVEANVPGASLERVVPMPHDYPFIGSPPVKNLVWKFPL